MSQPSIHIDIVSDIVCPWCWLGWRYLKQAIDQSGKEIHVDWRPYMLDANVPKEGMDYKSYMKSKFGDAPDNKFKLMRQHLEAAGPDAGIDFRFDGIPRRANTFASHQLMRWAQGQGRANDMAEALFRAFFTEHRDINKQNILAEVAEEAGMEPNIIVDLLRQNADAEAVQAEIDEISRAGIRSVPTYIYQRKYLVQGAQSADTHAKVIEKILTEIET